MYRSSQSERASPFSPIPGYKGGMRRKPLQNRVVSLTTSPPYGGLIDSVTTEKLLLQPSLHASQTKIQSCQYVASFSWLQREKPTIVVPGIPPKWDPLDTAIKLEEDSGTYFRDTNAAHYPQHPLEPAVRAIFMQAPFISPEEIDIVACGSTMGNLLQFARKSDKQIRFVVERIGETIFLLRRENRPDEVIQGIYGYGHTFPEAYTKLHDCVREADTHQRMIRYDLAGFQCIVRFESDGYLPRHEKLGSDDKSIYSRPLEFEGLKLLSGGNVVSQESLFDLKTRSSRKLLTLEDVLEGEMNRLWVKQIQNFVLAYHTRGVFDDIGVHNVKTQMQLWEKEHQNEIKILSAALSSIVEISKRLAGRRFEVCSSAPGVLEYRELGGDFSHALPEDLMRKWATSVDGSDESGEYSAGNSGSENEGGVDVLQEDDESKEGQDFTACSESCQYCGRCRYY